MEAKYLNMLTMIFLVILSPNCNNILKLWLVIAIEWLNSNIDQCSTSQYLVKYWETETELIDQLLSPPTDFLRV